MDEGVAHIVFSVSSPTEFVARIYGEVRVVVVGVKVVVVVVVEVVVVVMEDMDGW